MGVTDHPWALCAGCRPPTRLTRKEVCGTPWHGRCLLLDLRRQWREAKSEIQRQLIEQRAAGITTNLKKADSA